MSLSQDEMARIIDPEAWALFDISNSYYTVQTRLPETSEWMERLLAPSRERAAEIGVEFACLQEELRQLEHRRRWNVEEEDDGSVRICRGDHGRAEDCEWEEFVPRDEYDRILAALEGASARIQQLERMYTPGPSTSEDVIRAAFDLGVRSVEKPSRAPRAPRPQPGGDTGGEW